MSRNNGTGGRYKRTRRLRDVVTETPLGSLPECFVCDEHLSLSRVSMERRLYEIPRRHRGGKRKASFVLASFRGFFDANHWTFRLF